MSTRPKLDPLTFTDSQSSKELPDLRLPVKLIVALGAVLPGVGCYFCIAYSYVFQSKDALMFMSPYCPNETSPFPPISYAIGIWKPQKFIWLFVLFLNFPFRILFGLLYLKIYDLGISEAKKSTWYRKLVYLHMRSCLIEYFGLISVSVIDVESDFFFHAVCYAIWILPFNLNMFFNITLHYFSNLNALHPTYKRLFVLKCFLLISGCLISLSTVITYVIFDTYCIIYAYFAFSIAEYIIAGYNSLYYSLLYWELPDGSLDLNVRKFIKL